MHITLIVMHICVNGHCPSVRLLLDFSLNISTSHITGTPNAFEVILQLTCHIICLLTYSWLTYFYLATREW